MKTERHLQLLEEIKPIAKRMRIVDGKLDSYRTPLSDEERHELRVEGTQLHSKYNVLRRKIMVEMKKESQNDI